MSWYHRLPSRRRRRHRRSARLGRLAAARGGASHGVASGAHPTRCPVCTTVVASNRRARRRRRRRRTGTSALSAARQGIVERCARDELYVPVGRVARALLPCCRRRRSCTPASPASPTQRHYHALTAHSTKPRWPARRARAPRAPRRAAARPPRRPPRRPRDLFCRAARTGAAPRRRSRCTGGGARTRS